MKEAMGGISIFQIVVLFILLFTGIMCLTINQSKAFGVKDEIITIIQNENITSLNNSNYKLSSKTSKKISDHLNEAGYRITGDCPSNEWIGYDRNGNEVKNNASYCIKVNDVSDAFYKDAREKCKNNACTVATNNEYPTMVYYDVVLFYQLDIPVLNDVMNFKIHGSTKVLFG